MESYTYLLVNLSSILFPFLFSFHPKLRFYLRWKAFFGACAITALFFVGWDVWFTHMGVWGFNPRYLLNVYLFNLPIEEWLFFVCIPYASVFTYHCFKILFSRNFIEGYESKLTIALVSLLLLVGLWSTDKYYTFSTAMLSAVFLFFMRKLQWLSWFYFMYLIILVPFSIVNGLLTGSWIEEPVVWYNNAENLGIRVGTIPVEDVFYGMLLLGINVWLYEYILSKEALVCKSYQCKN